MASYHSGLLRRSIRHLNKIWILDDRELKWFIEQDIKGNVRLNGICLHYELARFLSSLDRPCDFCIKKKSFHVKRYEGERGSLACPFDVFIFRRLLSLRFKNRNQFKMSLTFFRPCVRWNLPTVNHTSFIRKAQTVVVDFRFCFCWIQFPSDLPDSPLISWTRLSSPSEML